MQKSEQEDEISPQSTTRVRRCVQSKLSFGKSKIDVVEKENGKGNGEPLEKEIKSSQSKLSCIEPLVEKEKILILDEEKEKCEEIEGEGEKGSSQAKSPKQIMRISQSKLPWHKPPVEEAKAVAIEEERDESEECEGKKKRKKRNYQKITPQKSPLKNNKEERRSSTRIKSNKNSQEPRNKQINDEDMPEMSPNNENTEHGRSSSKKNCKKKKNDAKKDVGSQNMNICHPDLWLDAKMAAEENSRLSAGKQTHPFFTSRKTAKILPDTRVKQTEAKCWPGLDGDYTVSCPPLHVIDSLEDGVTLFDWKNWVFEETPLSNCNGHCAIENSSSVLDGFMKPLVLDNLLLKGMPLNQSTSEENVQPSSADLEKFSSVDGQSFFDNLEDKQPNNLLTERLTSYFQRINCWPECSLWTNKYQPENALEVCGNSESVKFLGEWLKSWNEKSLQNSNNKKHILEPLVTEDSEDSTYEIESDMDDEIILKNVLLITGPVGSGKSAAVYACAKEQGFEVIEVNTSDVRNGAHMKQAFGQAMDSHALNKWSVEGPNARKRKLIFELFTSSTVAREDEELGNGSLELNSSSCKQDLTKEEIISWDTQEKSIMGQTANKSLILFEDVDTVFDEDRGFISSILYLAETAKRPIILTSNCRNPVLPQLLDRIVLDFVLPSKDDLLSHVSMICTSEKVHISSDLLEHLVRCCVGDIRKTLMLLQFWCQGNKLQIDKTIKSSYSPLAFDIDAAYLAIPKMISWELQCKLSEKVAEEINKAIVKIEEKNIEKMEAMQQALSSMQIKNLSKRRKNLDTPVKAKKKRALLKRNSSFLDTTDLLDHPNDLEDLLDSFDSPNANAHKTVKRRTGIVMSSQSEDASDDEHPCISQTHEFLPIDLNLNYPCEMHDTVRQPLENFEMASVSHICDTYKTQNVSCVPESCFMEGFLDISSQDTSFNLADSIKPVGTNNSGRIVIDLNKCLEDNCGNTCDIDVESVNGNEEVEDSQNENYFPSCRSQLMDECSRADFSLQLLPSTAGKFSEEVDLVQGTWKKLRGDHDLKSYLPAYKEDLSLILKHVSGSADLICEADIMFKSCYSLNNDILEPSMMPCFEPDICSFYEQQVEIGSTYAQHGLCYHTSNIAKAGYNLGHISTMDLAQGMLNSSMNTMALGKLLSKGNATHQNSCLEGKLEVTKPRCSIPTGREQESELYSAILTTMPARLSMVLRNAAFHDYVSFCSKISRLECSRLSQGIVEKRRRSRASQHYLSSGSFSLSDEQVQLLAQSNCFNQQTDEVNQTT